MRKKTLRFISIIFVMLVISSSCFASQYYKTINQWDYNYADAGIWLVSSVNLYTEAVSGFTRADLDSHFTYAGNQWSSIKPYRAVTDYSLADITVTGAKYVDLSRMNIGIASSNTAITRKSSPVRIRTYKYENLPMGIQNQERYGYRIDAMFIYIRYDYETTNQPRTTNAYRNTSTHEYGHAMGYFGESTVSSNVMWKDPNSKTTVSSGELRMLSQLY